MLFLDEPTIGLDPQTRSSIWRYIRALQETEGTTIFMTTHYMDEAASADRIAIMDRGEIVVLGAPEALKAGVGADRVVLGTADGAAAIAALRDRFGIEAAVAEGAVTFHVDAGEAFVAAAVRRAGRRHHVGRRLAADAGRRLHALHGHDDPRRGDRRRGGPDPGHDARAGGAAAMSVAKKTSSRCGCRSAHGGPRRGRSRPSGAASSSASPPIARRSRCG